jgi:hypothetical protein
MLAQDVCGSEPLRNYPVFVPVDCSLPVDLTFHYATFIQGSQGSLLHLKDRG